MEKRKDTHSRIPLAELVQEGCDTLYMCEKDKADLLQAGIDWVLIDSLNALTDKCSHADAMWRVFKGNKKVITGELKDMAKAAKKLRSKFARVIRTSKFFTDSGRTLPSMSRNNRYEDIIQDLYDLYYIAQRMCTSDPDAITDKNLMKKVHEMHHTLNDAYVKRACCIDSLIKYAQERDLVANELKKSLVEIHNTGRNAFSDDPVRAAGYSLRYHQAYRIKNKAKRKQKASKQKKLQKTTA